jgi:hypothetical protein
VLQMSLKELLVNMLEHNKIPLTMNWIVQNLLLQVNTLLPVKSFYCVSLFTIINFMHIWGEYYTNTTLWAC